MMEYLVSQGVKPDLVSAQGFGDSNPVASNDSAQGRAQNRRVELSLAGSSC
jgi:chemotaxis protein MotB